jgi:hypothetical protein
MIVANILFAIASIGLFIFGYKQNAKAGMAVAAFMIIMYTADVLMLLNEVQ